MSSVKDSYNILRSKVKDINSSNVLYGESVNEFDSFTEDLDYTDSMQYEIPIMVFEETMGKSNFFRFDYDRFDYGRFGDTGGSDEVVIV